MENVQEQLFDVKDLRVLVTGAASGLGRGFSEVLADCGAEVVMVDRDRGALELAVEELRKSAGHVKGIVTDVADEGELESAFEQAEKDVGSLDVVFANAGITGGRGYAWSDEGQLVNVDLVEWERVIRVNLTSVMLTMRAAARRMIPRRKGRIIVTASVSGLRTEPMVAYSYTASKTAVIGFTRQAAIELARHQITVATLAPGPIATNIAGGRPHDPTSRQRWIERVPMGRVGTVEDIKGLCLLLASPAASFITGSVFAIDGGLSAGDPERPQVT